MKARTVALLGAALLLPGLTVLRMTSCDFASSRILASEVVTIHEIQIIQSAQEQYKSQYGEYATALAELGPPASGAAGPKAADLISRNLASGDKNGYVFALAAIPTGYTINARPKVYNRTGRRTFYSDQTKQIHQNWSREPANASSPELR